MDGGNRVAKVVSRFSVSKGPMVQVRLVPAATADTIYEVPLQFEDWGLGDLVVRLLRLEDQVHEPDLAGWRALLPELPTGIDEHA